MTDSDVIPTNVTDVMEDQRSSAGLQNGLVGLGQDLVADLGVGDGPVFLAQVKTQLTLVAEV